MKRTASKSASRAMSALRRAQMHVVRSECAEARRHLSAAKKGLASVRAEKERRAVGRAIDRTTRCLRLRCGR